MEFNKEFLDKVRSGVRVFGSPTMRLVEEIKAAEGEASKYKSSFAAGDFFVPNYDIEGHIKELKALKDLKQKCGEYLLKLVNKCYDEPYKNMFIFCDVGLDNETRFDVVINTKYNTYFINFNNVTSKSPVYSMENNIYDANGSSLLEQSNIPKDLEPEFKYVVLDVSYTKNPTIILKNKQYYEASSLFMNISDLKKFFDEEPKEEIGKKRFEILQFLYDSIYKKEETEFVKNARKMIGL